MKKTSAFILGPLLATSAVAGPSFNQLQAFGPQVSTLITTEHIGAGGYQRGNDIECNQGVGQCSVGVGNSTIVTRSDTYGAYIWNASTPNCGNANRTGCQQELITPATMPASVTTVGYCATHFTCGVMDIRIAPSNTNHLYMYFSDGCIYSSLNKGVTWVQLTGFTCVTVNPNTTDNTPSFNHYMAVDPANENILAIGTPLNGVYYTTTGGTTFTHITTATIPGGTQQATNGGGNLIAFDPHSGTGSSGCGSQTTCTQGIYISSYGNGLYFGTGGIGGSFSETTTSGMPTNSRKLIVDATGTVFWIDNQPSGGNLYRLVGGGSGTWTEPINNETVFSVTYDPNNCASNTTCHVFAQSSTNNGQVQISTTDGTSFVSSGSNNARVATDIPYLQNTNEASMTVGDITIDPATGIMWFSEGIGVWNTIPPTTATSVTWTSASAAIEQLVSNNVYSPVGGSPLFAFWDRPIFVNNTPNTYPSQHGVNYAQSIMIAYQADCAPNQQAFCAVLAQFATDNTAFTTNGGGSDGAPSNWTQFPSITTLISPSGTTSGPLGGHSGGAIAVSTSQDILICSSNNSGCGYTLNQGATWNVANVPGVEMAAGALASASTATNSNVLHFSPTPANVVAHPTWFRVTDYSNTSAITSGVVTAATSSTVTIGANVAQTVNTNDSFSFDLNGSDPAGGITGWGWSQNNNYHTICSDAAGNGTYYGYNYIAPGIFKFTNGGQNISLVFSGSLNAFGGTNDQMKCVPGVSGDMFYTPGYMSGSHPNNNAFYECLDTGTVACNAVSNVEDVWVFGFGKAQSSFPTIFCYCAVNLGSGFTMGYWRSPDHGVTWTQVGLALQNTLDTPTTMSGDMNTFGKFYVGYSGSGFQCGAIGGC